MKNLKKKIGLVFMTFAMLCSIIPEFDIKLHANEYYTFNETLNEDQSEAVIELSIKQQIGKKVQKIELPDQSEAELTTDENGTTKTSYTAKENGKYDFKITYQEEKTDSLEVSEPLSAEELEETLSYEVKDIKDIAIKEEEKEEEETVKNEETQELGLAAEGEYVAQAIFYDTKGKAELIAKFKTLQEALEYKVPLTNGSGGSTQLEILKDVIVDETLVIPECELDGNTLRFYTYITTAPSKNHTAIGNPEVYSGSSNDGRAILKRGPNNKGALIDRTNLNLTASNTSDFNMSYVSGAFSNLILDGGKAEGLNGDSLIISDSTDGRTGYMRSVLVHVKFMNNKNIKGKGGAIRSLLEAVHFRSIEVLDCDTDFDGGAIYFELPSDRSNSASIGYMQNMSITNCSAKGNGGGIFAKNGVTGSPGILLLSNLKLINNRADGNGGGAYLVAGQTILNSEYDSESNSVQSFEVGNNSAGLLGSGIYFTSPENVEEATLMITNRSNPGYFKIFDNKDASTKGNLYIDDGVSLTIYDYAAGPIKGKNVVGLTLAGKDKNGLDRMADGAMIGTWNKMINNSSNRYLESYIRDSDIGEYMYADEGEFLSKSEEGREDRAVIWSKSPLKFTKVDVKDNTKTLANAEFTLYQCDDNTHDHSKDPETDLVKDSTCWKSMKKVTSNVDGIVDFEELNSGQYMLVESKAPAGYIAPAGQWFIKVNNAPNVVSPQSYHDKVIIMKRGKILPPDLTVTLDSDNLFASAQITNTIGHTVTFDPMGGTMDQSEITQGVATNELLIRPTDPTRDSDIFLGWYKDQGLTEEWNFATDRVTKDMTLYAKWKEVYVAQAVYYGPKVNDGKGEVLMKFKTLQEALDYKVPSSTADSRTNLEILKDVIVDETLVLPECEFDGFSLRFYSAITTAPSENHTAIGNPELYSGSSSDGRAILKRGPNNKGALIDRTKFSMSPEEVSIPHDTTEKGSFSYLILDGGKAEGLSGDSLIISGSTDGTSRKIEIYLHNMKFMNNKNTKGNGGAVRSLLEKLEIRNNEVVDCDTDYDGGAFYFELPSDRSNGNITLRSMAELSDISITNCSAKGNGGGIFSKNGVDGYPGYLFLYSLKLTNNRANGNGGGAYFASEGVFVDSLYGQEGYSVQEFEVSKNSAGLLGSGIYFTPPENVKNARIFINPENATGLSHYKIFDNEDAQTKGNLYIDEGASLFKYYAVNEAIKEKSVIGVTLAGKDKNGLDRMADGAEIGAWFKILNDNTNFDGHLLPKSSARSLEIIVRDSDIDGYMYAGDGEYIGEFESGLNGVEDRAVIWPKSPLKFTKVDVKDNTKALANAEFTLYQCSDNTHDHSKDPVTALVKDSDCWKSIKTVTSNADGIVDFEGLSTGQHMLVESKAPTGYATPEGQWFIKVNNAPNVVSPQSYYDKVTITRRGTVLPPELTIKLDKDKLFESGQVTNIAEHTITFDPQGGTMLEAEKTQKVIDDNLIIQPTNPTREFFEFDGWYQNSDYTGNPWNFGSDKVTGDVTLYAKWKVSDASYFISIPKQITLEDGMDGYAQKKETISIVKNQADSKWYPEEDILIKTATQITLTNPDNSDSYDVSVYDENDSKHTDSNKELMALNVKDDTKQSADFTLKTPISNTKMKNRYTGIMTFVIQFRP